MIGYGKECGDCVNVKDVQEQKVYTVKCTTMKWKIYGSVCQRCTDTACLLTRMVRLQY